MMPPSFISKKFKVRYYFGGGSGNELRAQHEWSGNQLEPFPNEEHLVWCLLAGLKLLTCGDGSLCSPEHGQLGEDCMASFHVMEFW